ncbi:MAG: hypothetical protein DMG32_00610 [Acidobacteria bacterium]|nr:MAG: hypothetical protein DMG32_00610 [Acidobacteriota bacterium]
MLTKDNKLDCHFSESQWQLRSAITEGETMNSLFQAEEASSSTGKKVAVAIVILAVSGLVLWAGLEMALRLISGR